MTEAPKLAWRSPALSTFRIVVKKKYQALDIFVSFWGDAKKKKINLFLNICIKAIVLNIENPFTSPQSTS